MEDTKGDQGKDNSTNDGGGRRNAQEDPTLMEPMLLTVGVGRTPAMVEMDIMGHTLTNTIVNGGSRVILPRETWKVVCKSTL